MKKSFTLIELLIVIGILAILVVTILITLNPSKAQKNARDLKRKKDLETIHATLLQTIQDGKQIPIGTCISSHTDCWPLLISKDYLNSMPNDPIMFDGGQACSPENPPKSFLYVYYSPDGANFQLVTRLENSILTTDPNYYSGTVGCSGFANYAVREGL